MGVLVELSEVWEGQDHLRDLYLCSFFVSLFKMLFRRYYTWSYCRQHYSLIAQHGCIILGAVLAGAYSMRCLIKSPDVVINKKNMEPWNDKGPTYQYRLWSSLDYSKFKYDEDRPNIYNK